MQEFSRSEVAMKKAVYLMAGVCAMTLGVCNVQAQTAATTTTTTEIQSPDGTTTTVIAPGAAAPPVVEAPKPNIDAGGGTTVVVDPPAAIDAISGKPVATEAPKEEESLRDRVRSKMD